MSWPALLVCLLAILAVAGLYFAGNRLKINHKPYWQRPLIVSGLIALAALAGLFPLKPLDPGQLTTDSDIVFVVDATYSMNAIDGRDGKARLDDVRNDLRTFAQNLGGSRFGIILYEKTGTLYLPLTTTYSDVDTAAGTISTSPYLYANFDPSLTASLGFVEEYLKKVQAKDVTRHQVAVLMTDGELTGEVDTPDSVKAAAEKLGAVADASLVIGYGTQAGAKMPEIQMSLTGNGELKNTGRFASATVDGKFTEVISRRDETQLRALATGLKGQYIPAQEPGQATQALLQARKQAAGHKAASPESIALRQNTLHVPLAIAILAWLFISEVLALSRARQLVGSWRKNP